MKYFQMFIFLACTGLFITNTSNAQQKHHIFEQPASAATDSSDFTIYQLYTPENNLTSSGAGNPANPFPPYRPIKGITKTLLIFGADLIRDDENSIYSFDNTWRYPGPTVKYPQSFTDLELFLERYNTYTSSTQ